MSDVPVIHAVTDSAAVCRPDFLHTAERNMRALGSRGAVHLRGHMLPAKLLHGLAEKLADLQADTGCWLVVNDRVDIAAAVGARGVQLTSRSMTVRDARAVAPRQRVGTSIHTLQEALDSERDGADWCVAGNIFPTPSHPDRDGAKESFVRDLVGAVSIPVIAIGGVEAEDIPALLDAGAWGVATIRGSGWDGRTESIAPEAHATVLDARAGTSPVSPLARYISTYDAYRRGQRSAQPHDQRRPPGNSR